MPNIVPLCMTINVNIVFLTKCSYNKFTALNVETANYYYKCSRFYVFVSVEKLKVMHNYT